MQVDKTGPSLSPAAAGLEKISNGGVSGAGKSGSAEKAQGIFGELLDKKLGAGTGVDASGPAAKTTVDGLKFSNHALERLASRGLFLRQDDLTRISDAVEKAAKKGSKESLILMDGNAFIVSVKNKTVVTAMPQDQMKENVFTNIDSTVIL